MRLPKPPEYETQYEALKRQLLDNKWVAFSVIGVIIMTGLATLANDLSGLRSLITLPESAAPGPVTVIRSDPQDPLLKDQGTLFEAGDGKPIVAEPIPNDGHTGFDAREIRTDNQSHYNHRLTDGETKRANEYGWTLHSNMRAKQGAAMVGVEFGPPYRRWDIWLYQRDGKTLVGLPRRFLAEGGKKDGGVDFFDECEISRDETGYVDLKLIFDAGLKTADLYVNDTPRIRHYPGWTDYNKQKQGVFYGTWAYAADKGTADFKLVSFVTF
jgi:hypothetical protein